MSDAADFTKVVVAPVLHEASGRVTRRTWAAFLATTESDYAQPCKHTHGHRTQVAAVECGKAMWRKAVSAT